MKTKLTKAEILSKCGGEVQFSERFNTLTLGGIPFAKGSTWELLGDLVGDYDGNNSRENVAVTTADGFEIRVVWFDLAW